MTAKNIPQGHTRIDGVSLLRSSEKAFLFSIDGVEQWLPKSQTTIAEDDDHGGDLSTVCQITIPTWLAEKNNLRGQAGDPDPDRRPSGKDVDPSNVIMPTAPLDKAHNGTYTASIKGGGHKTFRLRTQQADANFAPGQRTIAYLAGADNETDYIGIGFVDVVDGETIVKPWRKWRDTEMAALAQEVLTIADAMADTKNDAFSDPIGMASGGTITALDRSAKCIRCNRKLTTPTSIARGIGPICEGK